MTHATKAIYRWLLCDFVKVSSNASTEAVLYTDQDIQASMEHIEALDFHQELEVNGIKFTAFHAGHVLGAAMFMLEIAGVRILYTGDFSRQEDRHLMCAELPPIKPDVLITESTYGTHIHDKREEREARFVGLVHDIVARGGRCLIPAFALGRAQELMLILDEYWSNHPELHDVPIYYASQLAKKCMSVYQTYIHAMNDHVRRSCANNNPFVFKHISNMRSIEEFDDMGPCVVMASPGMMQSGLSRELFENWCTDRRNGVIIAGYCVEGTLAKTILSHPEEIPTMSGQTLPLKCSVDYISFSAHTDYQQTSEFIREMKPSHIVLVHGEMNEMMRLKSALIRQYEDDESYRIDIHTPKNAASVFLHFRGEKMAKVVGVLAKQGPEEEGRISGVLIKKNFSYHIVAPDELPTYTDLATSVVTQRLALAYTGPPSLLQFHLTMVAGALDVVKQRGDLQVFKVFDCVTVTWELRLVTIEWQSNPINDMFADAVQTVVLKSETEGMPWEGIPHAVRMDRAQFRRCVLDTLRDMFGEEAMSALKPDPEPGEQVQLCINDKDVFINLEDLSVKCDEHPKLRDIVQTAISRLHSAITPVCIDT